MIPGRKITDTQMAAIIAEIKESVRKKGLIVTEEQIKEQMEDMFRVASEMAAEFKKNISIPDQKLRAELLTQERASNLDLGQTLMLIKNLEYMKEARKNKVSDLIKNIDQGLITDDKKAQNEYTQLSDEKAEQSLSTAVATQGNLCSTHVNDLRKKRKNFQSEELQAEHKKFTDAYNEKLKILQKMHEKVKNLNMEINSLLSSCSAKIKRLEESNNLILIAPETPPRSFRSAIVIGPTPTGTPERTPPKVPRVATPFQPVIARKLFDTSIIPTPIQRNLSDETFTYDDVVSSSSGSHASTSSSASSSATSTLTQNPSTLYGTSNPRRSSASSNTSNSSNEKENEDEVLKRVAKAPGQKGGCITM